MDDLERGALEVLRLVRSIKNKFVPINRIPPEILSLIPDYYDEYATDQALISLTHVSRHWRDVFTSRPSLWTGFDFKNVDKTHTYIQRSKHSPLRLCLVDGEALDHAFALIIPHIHRLRSLTIDGPALPSSLRHFRCHTPFLEKLDIWVSTSTGSPLDDALFNGDLSSLRELRLCGVITQLPWKNLTNLRVIELKLHDQSYGTTQILDLLESAPLLSAASLAYSMPESPDAPPTRIVQLRHMKDLTIDAAPPHPIILHHLHIPTGGSLTISGYYFRGEDSPLLGQLAERFPIVNNMLSHITTINLRLDLTQKCVRLSGPSGSLRVLVVENDWRNTLDPGILNSLGRLVLSAVQNLVALDWGIVGSDRVKKLSSIQIMSSLRNLRTLTTANSLMPLLILDPTSGSSSPVLCPKLEELVLYLESWNSSSNKILMTIAENRALRGAKLSLITFVDLQGPRVWVENMTSALRKHVTRVQYTVADALPAWDEVPGEGVGKGV